MWHGSAAAWLAQPIPNLRRLGLHQPHVDLLGTLLGAMGLQGQGADTWNATARLGSPTGQEGRQRLGADRRTLACSSTDDCREMLEKLEDDDKPLSHSSSSGGGGCRHERGGTAVGGAAVAVAPLPQQAPERPALEPRLYQL